MVSPYQRSSTLITRLQSHDTEPVELVDESQKYVFIGSD